MEQAIGSYQSVADYQRKYNAYMRSLRAESNIQRMTADAFRRRFDEEQVGMIDTYIPVFKNDAEKVMFMTQEKRKVRELLRGIFPESQVRSMMDLLESDFDLLSVSFVKNVFTLFHQTFDDVMKRIPEDTKKTPARVIKVFREILDESEEDLFPKKEKLAFIEDKIDEWRMSLQLPAELPEKMLNQLYRAAVKGDKSAFEKMGGDIPSQLLKVNLSKEGVNTPKRKRGHPKRIVGKGIEVKEKEVDHFVCGIYKVHRQSLEEGQLSVYYKNNMGRPTLKQFRRTMSVSEGFAKVLLKLLKTGELPLPAFYKLSQDDQSLLLTLLKGAKCYDILDKAFEDKLPEVNPENVEHAMKRFELIRGQLLAGNNHPDLLKELAEHVDVLYENGRLNDKERVSIFRSMMLV